MAQWDFEHPGRGDTAAVYSASQKLQTSANAVSDARRVVSGARDEVTPAIWEGAAQPVWVAGVQEAVDAMHAFWESLTSVKNAIYNYGAYVDGIATQANLARRNLHDAQTVIDNLPSEYPSYWEQPLTEQQSAKIQDTRDDAIAKKGRAERDLIDLGAERTAADNNLIKYIQKALPASWNDQRAALAAIGIQNVGDLKGGGLRDAIADIAARSATGVPLSDENMAALKAYLDLYANDEEELSEFYQQIGGEGAVGLIQQLGTKITQANYNNDGVLAVAQQIRSSLSLGSAHWDEDQAAKFGQAAMYGNPAADANVLPNTQALGWLFSDPQHNPMGEQLSIDLANRINEWEFEQGKGALVWPSPLDSEDSDASRLYAWEHAGDGWSIDPIFEGGGRDAGADGNGIASNDLAGRVFETLGQYPNSALEFLESGDLAFRDYWFDKRDWSGADQFEGPAALWNGAQHVEGGPMGEPADGLAGVQERLALLSSQIMWQLDQNEAFIWENVSNDAAAEFARTLAPYLGGFADQMVDHRSYDHDAPGFMEVSVFGQSSPTPGASQETIAHFFGTLGGRPGGAATLQEAVYDYQDKYLVDGFNGGTTMQEAFERFNALQGSLDGAGIGATLNGAERADALTDKQMDAFLTALGIVPIPGPDIIGSIGSFIESVGGAHINDGMHVYEGVFQDMMAKGESLETMADFRNTLAMYDVFQTDGMTPPPDLDALSGSERKDAIDDWMKEVSPDLEQASAALPDGEVDLGEMFSHYETSQSAAEQWARDADA